MEHHGRKGRKATIADPSPVAGEEEREARRRSPWGEDQGVGFANYCTGSDTGAPTAFTKNTRIFAGCVRLALRETL